MKRILPKPLDGIVKWKVTKKDGRISLDYEIDHEAQEAYVEKHFGKSILFTNRDEWGTEQIILAYRGQGCIKGSFRYTKDPHFIGWSPKYHWTDQKIRVHAFYCVPALTLSALLRRWLAKAGMEYRGHLGSTVIYEVAHIYPSETCKKDAFTPSEINQVQRMLTQTLGLEAMHRLAS